MPASHDAQAVPADVPAVSSWSAADASDLYRVAKWSDEHFGVSPTGGVTVGPDAALGKGVELLSIVRGLEERGVGSPVLLRFANILDDRLADLHKAFTDAIESNNYKGSFCAAYPIKVNQQHQVVEEVSRSGRRFGFGIEVGSKPELLAVLAMTAAHPEQLIICNGFKDSRYIRTVVLAHKLGRRIIPVIENLGELELLLRHSEEHDVVPVVGVRVKLACAGSGRWQHSAGDRSKFGLNADELLQLVDTLRGRGLLDSLQLLHCHAGSQLQDVRALKQIVTEISHVYAELSRAGAPMRYLDVGGGLGVDYTGARTSDASSMNYSLEEFANHVVYRVGAVCDSEGFAHPTIVTECGRAMTAYSSVLVFNVLGASGPTAIAARASVEEARAFIEENKDDPPQPMLDLLMTHETAHKGEDGVLLECFHDALEARSIIHGLYSLGYLPVRARAIADRLFWATCVKIGQRLARAEGDLFPADDATHLEELLCETYFCNLSVFQSLPDCWAIGQLFPIMPIHRLDEEPSVRAILADITCDSDGAVSRFPGETEPRSNLPVHPLRDNESYYIGVFLVGAYQETLGDLHNLFGDTHAVHVRVDDDRWVIEDLVKGDSVRDVLTYMQHDPAHFVRTMQRDCEGAVQRGDLSVAESRDILRFYDAGISGYTYLEGE